MALLPEDPKDQQRLLVIIVPLALAVLFFLYIYRPKVEDLDLLEDRVADMDMRNRMARERTKNLDGLREELAHAELRFAALERLVPTGAEVPEIYEAIASESEALNLDLRNVIPIEAEADSAAYFLRQNWEMEVEGSYHDLGDFLTRVASFDRIVRPQVREIRPVEGTDASTRPVTAYFELETFVLPPTVNPSAQAGAGDSGG